MNQSSRTLVLASCIAWVAGGTGSYADGFRNPPPDAVGLSRANALAAQVEGPTAVSYNPAHLAGQRDVSVVVAVTLASSEHRWNSPLGFSARTEDDWLALPNVYVAGPLGERWAWGLGLTTPYGQAVDWGPDSPVAAVTAYYARMDLLEVAPAVAWALDDRIRIGLALGLIGSQLEFRQVVPWERILAVPGLPAGEARVETTGVGLAPRLGASWSPIQGHSLAVVFQSPYTVEYEGDMKLRRTPRVPGLQSADFETELEFPARVTLAYGVELTPAWRIEADVEWLGWSAMSSLPLRAGPNQPLVGTDSLPYDWKDTWTFNAGLEWRMTDHWRLRTGYSYLPTPVPDHTFSPTLPDEDRHIAAVGLGYRLGRHELDLAWCWSIVSDRRIAGNVNPAVDGTYEFDPQLWAIAYRYIFGP